MSPPRRRPARISRSLSIEELAQLPVRSASKREEPLSAAPTALFVITGDDIAGSAATSLPEVLRLAPNLQVQQVNGREYAISARGFNGYRDLEQAARADRRPQRLFARFIRACSGTCAQPLLEDIEQIEVISGPGGTLYGPNAVNGVINITTRDARETIGGLVRGTAGSVRTDARRRATASRSAANGAVRVYGNAFDREDLPDGRSARRSTIGPRLAGRLPRRSRASDRDHFTLQGDLFDNETDVLPGRRQSGPQPRRALDRAGSTTPPRFRIQAYYDHFRAPLPARPPIRCETFDVDAQYNRYAGQPRPRRRRRRPHDARRIHQQRQPVPARPAAPAAVDRTMPSSRTGSR